MAQITITFPDGAKKQFDAGITALDVAKSISEGLARVALAAMMDGKPIDLSAKLTKSCAIRILTWKDKEGVEVFRHSSAHLLANAVKELFPYAKPTIGPVVEEGFYYDFDHEPFTPEDLEKIEKKMEEIASRKLPIERLVLKEKEALELFKDNQYKQEIIRSKDSTEVAGEEITAYKQGEFVDLCRGPHLPNAGMIKAVKLTKIAGAYWRGDQKNKQLQRIYGISFPERKELVQYLTVLEEAKKRDHRVIGKQLDLFSFHEESPGAPFYHPKGAIIFNTLQAFIRDEYRKRGYQEVITPLLYDKSLWETSGHWQHYQQNMFTLDVDGKPASFKPMNCPSHCLIYKTRMWSYRDLPLRIADFAPLHRNELRGVLGGMTRVRKFQQDDAHIFCAVDQLEAELLGVIDFVRRVYQEVFKFDYHVELSTKPEDSLGTKEQWDIAENGLKRALEAAKIPYKINPGDGAFYGPKIDIHMKDCLGRSWQLATIQLDFQLPLRFGLTYEGADGKKHAPIMVHRAVLGSLDRFMGVLIEHYAGKFPLWLSPSQVAVLTVADRHQAYAEEVTRWLLEAGLRVDLDARSESIPKKVREAQLAQYNYILVVGDKEAEAKTVAVRTRSNEVLGERDVTGFIRQLQQEIEERR